MPRKKVTTDDDADVKAAADLDDDEEIQITDTRRIRKTRRKPEEPAPPAIEIDAEDDDDFEIVEPLFEDGTIGSLLTRDEDEELKHQQCTIIVTRKPDSAGEKFVKPCVVRITEAPLRNIDLTMPQNEIEELVRTYYGGGHYYLQIRLGTAIRTGWSCDLADAPDAAAKARAAELAAANPQLLPAAQPAEPTTNPVDDFLNSLRKQKEMQDLLFGEERRRFEKEIADLKAEIASKPASREPQSDLALLLSVMKETNNPTIIEFAREYLSPENAEPKFGVWDFAKYVFDNREAIAPLAAMMLGGGGIPNAGGIEAVLKMQPPAGAIAGGTEQPAIEPPPQPRTSRFRRAAKTDTPAGDGENADTRSATTENDDDTGTAN